MKIGVFKGHSTDTRVRNTVDSFTKGLEYLGENYFVDVEYRDCDVAVIWGISSKRAYKKTGYRDIVRERQRNTIVIERGFIERDTHYSVGWGDTGGLGDYVNSEVCADRWANLGVTLEPWNSNGETVLFCGQVPHDTSVQHVDYPDWVRSTIEELRNHSDRPIVFRNHPLHQDTLGPFDGAVSSSNSLAGDLREAHAVITFNSTAGVEAVIAGIPTFSFDRRSMVYDITSHDVAKIESPATPDRSQWAARLGYSQWHIDEIERGEPWLHLKQKLNNKN